jgi:integrase
MKLTKKAIDAIKPTSKRLTVWDSELRGFGLRVEPSGRKVFTVDYTTDSGRRRRLSLGSFGALTPDEARRMAREKLSEVARGADPLAAKEAKRSALTMAEFAEVYKEKTKATKKPASRRMDEMNLRLHILPAMKNLKVTEVTRQDVSRLHTKMSDKPVQANRVLALLSHMMNKAAEWGYRPEGPNPAQRMKKHKEEGRERYLTSEELERLGKVLTRKQLEHPAPVLAVRLLLLTGMRLNEVLTLKWEMIDFERGVINLPDTKTGRRAVPLGGAALHLLKDAPRMNEWVIPSVRRKGQHLVNLNIPWSEIRKEAGIEDVRLHDLRHAFGSVGAQAGLSVPMVAGLLGHKEWRTSQKYAHLADAGLRSAADLVSGEIAAALEGKDNAQDNAQVIDLPVGK